ncbi:MAG TPA: M17 family peptidase N-terminal domain-containing protein, partial [Rhizomicrobium sp.]|nr:M17 family peptidase N-terminal domain-containing protein [Rhizomicrobium sp.]
MQVSFAGPGAEVMSGSWVVAAGVGKVLAPAALHADKASGGALTRGLKVSRFAGKAGEFLEVLAPAGLSVSRILLVGLGKPEALDEKALEKLGAEIVQKLEALGESAATLEIDAPKAAKLKTAAAHLAFGARLRSYAFNKYRTKELEEHKKRLGEIRLLTPDPPAVRRAYAALDAVADGIFLARDLVNEPPNVLHPEEFARRVKALARTGLKVEVLGEAEMKKLGFGALLGVGQGSARESQLVIMQWNGGKKKNPPLAFVGKGVCFDSGGLSLKPG